MIQFSIYIMLIYDFLLWFPLLINHSQLLIPNLPHDGLRMNGISQKKVLILMDW